MPNKSKIIKTSTADIWINEDGILYVKVYPGVEIDKKEVEEVFGIYEQLGCRQNKVLQIIDATQGGTMTKEGRDLSNKYSKDYFLASAVISKSLAVKLIVNFFNYFYKVQIPLKFFNTEKEGLEWLSQYKKISP